MSVVEIKKSGAIPVEVTQSKAFSKVEKNLGNKKAMEFLSMTDEQLNQLVAQSSLVINETNAKVNGNREYLKAKDVVDTFKSGAREAIKPFKETIALALEVLRSRKEG